MDGRIPCSAVVASVRASQAEATDLLLRRSTLCTHGGLSPVEAALHSHPRLGAAMRVGMVRLVTLRLEPMHRSSSYEI